MGVCWQATALGRQLPLGCRPPGQRRAHDRLWAGPPFAISVAAGSGEGVSAQLNQGRRALWNRLPWTRSSETAKRPQAAVWTRLSETRAWIGPVQVRRGPYRVRQDTGVSEAQLGSSTRLPTMVVWLSAAICLLLKVVAVAGRRVPHQLLATVAGLDDRQLDVAGCGHQPAASGPTRPGRLRPPSRPAP